MKAHELIKTLFQPIQPTIRASQDTIIYRERGASPKLQNFIYCYWQLKTTEILVSPFIYRVVADGCVDIFFNLNNPTENFVMGFCKQYTEFPLDNYFNYVGIRFFPAAFPNLFGINAKSLSNTFHDLNTILPTVSNFIETQISPNQTFPQIVEMLDNLMLSIIAQKTLDFDTRFFEALHLIFKSFGTLETESDLNTGLSPRQLRRLFNHYIGTTPKTFCKVVRFQQILNAKPSTQSLRQSKIFYDIGYFDQAHFIKDFKNFYGVTPSKAFR